MDSRVSITAICLSVAIHVGTFHSVSPSLSGALVGKPKEPIFINTVQYRTVPEAPKKRVLKKSQSKPRPVKNERVTMRGSDLAADPKKGKIFVGYFADVKEKINHTVRRKYAEYNPGKGEVVLQFLLNDNGSLESVTVDERNSSPDLFLRNFAKECIRESAPFGQFPKNLETEMILFAVTVSFDER